MRLRGNLLASVVPAHTPRKKRPIYPDKTADNRSAFQRDRDRILYTTSFRRLARVTQVVSADEGHVFHNRLTHSLQVAQVGRRIAEKLVRDATGKTELEINADVVEAACLAHDLGHPPFGHIAERELDHLAHANGLSDGYEGNAQSFRIVTRLAMGSTEHGLNLTRATLNVILKYPWLHGENRAINDKWGAYFSDKEIFNWARELGPATLTKSIEAELMDWSDDVTYSVHDVDDFFRAGVIPLDRLVLDSDERARFYEEVFERRGTKLPRDMDETYLRDAFDNLVTKLPIRKPFAPTQRERVRLRSVTSPLIGSFVNAVQIKENRVQIEKKQRAEIFMLKQLTWHYVIKNPALATQQHGQTTIVRTLFESFYKAGTSSIPNKDLFPQSVRELLPELPPKTEGDRQQIVRTILDFISSLTEEQAVSTFHRISGIALGSSLSYKVR
jgi:dGTPase